MANFGSFVKVTDYDRDHVASSTVYTLSFAQKQRLLGQGVAKQSSRVRATLQRLEEIYPSVAPYFSAKADRIEDLALRLIAPPSNFSDETPLSYIALSYCWKHTALETEADRHAKASPGRHPLPISRRLFGALLKELRPSEGLWWDEACINQQDRLEKEVAIGFMDVVYSEARCTLVALDDILISTEEQDFLEAYLAQPDVAHDNYLSLPYRSEHPPPGHPLLFALCQKLFECRWFSRAFCAQEMQMGKNHIFLAPCARRDTVFRFTSHFLLHVLLLDAEIFNPQPAMTFGQKNDRTFTVSVGNSDLASISLLEAFSHIVPLGAGGDPDLSGDRRRRSANRDKLAIVLNISHLGLLFKPDAFNKISDLQNLSIHHYRALAALSLAANEPMALCTTGEPIDKFPASGTSSWLPWFDAKDWQSQIAWPLELPLMDSPYLRFDPELMDRSIDIQLSGFGPGLRVKGAQKGNLAASAFDRAVMRVTPPAVHAFRRSGFYKWRTFTEGPPERRRLFLSTLACMMQLGTRWIQGSSSLTNPGFLAPTEGYKLLSDVDNPEVAQLQSCWDAVLSTKDAEAAEKEIAAWLSRQANNVLVARTILQFAAELIFRAISSVHWASDELLAQYLPSVITISPPPSPAEGAEGGDTSAPAEPEQQQQQQQWRRQHLVFLPASLEGPIGEGSAQIVVPTAIVGDAFHDLNRVWFVKKKAAAQSPSPPEKEEGKGGEEERAALYLLGKQRLFGPSIEGALLSKGLFLGAAEGEGEGKGVYRVYGQEEEAVVEKGSD